MFGETFGCWRRPASGRHVRLRYAAKPCSLSNSQIPNRYLTADDAGGQAGSVAGIQSISGEKLPRDLTRIAL
jgi:hypothetical protein